MRKALMDLAVTAGGHLLAYVLIIWVTPLWGPHL